MWWKWVLSALSMVVGALSFMAGVNPSDARSNIRDWLGSVTPSGDLASWLFVLLGVVLIGGGAIWAKQLLDQRGGRSSTDQLSQPSNMQGVAREEAAAPEPSGEWDEPFRFDPHSLIVDIAKIDLMHISESYVDFEIDVRNLSGRRVKIEGFAGLVSIAGAKCASPPSLSEARGWIEPEAREGGLSHVLHQPITPETRQQIAGGAGGGLNGETWVKRFNLSSVSLVGVYEEDGVEHSLPDDCFLYGVDFNVRGPLKDEADAQALHRLPTTFISQEQYDSNGVRKQVIPPEPLVEIDPDGTMQRLKITNRGPRDRFRVKVEQLEGTEQHETEYDLPWRGHEDDLWLELNTDEPGTVDVVDRTMPHFKERDGGSKTVADAIAGRNSVLFQSRGQAAFPRTLVKDQRVQMKIVVYPEGPEGGTERLYELWFEPFKRGYEIHFEEVNPR